MHGFEHAREIQRIVVGNLRGDLFDRQTGLPQQFSRAIHALLHQPVQRRIPGHAPEQQEEIGWRQPRHRAQGRNVQRLVKVRSHVVEAEREAVGHRAAPRRAGLPRAPAFNRQLRKFRTGPFHSGLPWRQIILAGRHHRFAAGSNHALTQVLRRLSPHPRKNPPPIHLGSAAPPIGCFHDKREQGAGGRSSRTAPEFMGECESVVSWKLVTGWAARRAVVSPDVHLSSLESNCQTGDRPPGQSSRRKAPA